MSLKAELETWAAALKAYDEDDFEKSLELFSVGLDPVSCHSMLILAMFSKSLIPQRSSRIWA